MRHKYSDEIVKKMRDLYVHGYSQERIGRELNIPWQSVWPYIKDIQKSERKILPSRGIILPIPKQSVQMTSQKARIIAYMMADGYVSTFIKTSCHKTKKGMKTYSYEAPSMAFYNKDLDVIEKFISDCKQVYGVDLKYNAKRMEVKIYRKEIFNDLRRYGKFSTFEWRIPKEIMEGSSEVKREWIKAFCDSEATVGVKRKDIVVYSANKKGLSQVCSILSELGISSRIYGFYAGAFRLRINGKDNLIKFHKNCNFYHLLKREKLSKIIGRS